MFFSFSVFGGVVCAEEFPAVVEADIQAVLSAEREGILSDLKVDTGDQISRGGLVGVVYHKDLILRKELYEANKNYLEIKVENLTRLHEKGLATEEELALAQKELAVNEKEISIIQSEIDRSLIHSPFSGRIVTRHIQPHEWVKPGQPVVELYDPRRLRVVADIPSEIAVGMKEKQTNTIFFPALNESVEARLAVLSPQVDVRSNTRKVYWTVDGKDVRSTKLIPGMKGVLKVGSQ